MPAQKLTKVRLAQILIMLSILVGAFFWRTFTYETPDSIDCSQKERCDLTISGEKISINRNSMGISFETPKSSSLKIDPDQSGAFKDVRKFNQIIEWESISPTKMITLKIEQNIVVVHL